MRYVMVSFSNNNCFFILFVFFGYNFCLLYFFLDTVKMLLFIQFLSMLFFIYSSSYNTAVNSLVFVGHLFLWIYSSAELQNLNVSACKLCFWYCLCLTLIEIHGKWTLNFKKTGNYIIYQQMYMPVNIYMPITLIWTWTFICP